MEEITKIMNDENFWSELDKGFKHTSAVRRMHLESEIYRSIKRHVKSTLYSEISDSHLKQIYTEGFLAGIKFSKDFNESQ